MLGSISAAATASTETAAASSLSEAGKGTKQLLPPAERTPLLPLLEARSPPGPTTSWGTSTPGATEMEC